MSGAASTILRGRLVVWLLIAAGLLLVGVANWHLAHVAVTSQPACVSHLRPGEGDAGRREYGAAQSSCTP